VLIVKSFIRGSNGCIKLSVGSCELFSFKLRFIHIELILISDTEKSWKICKKKYIPAMNAENYLSRRKDYPAIKGRLMGTANGNVTNAMYHLLAPS
jgi:hypothetical protein